MPFFKKRGRALLEQRPQLSFDAFYQQYYKQRGISKDVVRRVIQCFENVLEYNMTGILPSDRLVQDIADDWDSLWDAELISSLESEFNIDAWDKRPFNARTFDEVIQRVLDALSRKKCSSNNR